MYSLLFNLSFNSLIKPLTRELFTKITFFDILEIFILEMGQISSDLLKRHLHHDGVPLWLMTSEEKQRPMLVTAGYGRHWSQWVK